MKKIMVKLLSIIVSIGFLFSATGCSQEFFETVITEALGQSTGVEESEDYDESSNMEIEAEDLKEDTTEEVEIEEEKVESDNTGYFLEDGVYYPLIESIEVSTTSDSEHIGANLADYDYNTSWISDDMDTITASIVITFAQEFTISDVLIAKVITIEAVMVSISSDIQLVL